MNARLSRRSEDLIVFLGPSLPRTEALALVRCRVLPPARQGDVWKALSFRPRAIALIDGVFESQPSVWHREILTALQSGVAVFGGASMGALRAAELDRHGMVGVGQIYRGYRDGMLVDDAEVALLHADAEHGYRALSVPLVNVRHAARRAQAKKVLDEEEAEQLVEVAAQIFYQERHWPTVIEAVTPRWRKDSLARWQRFAGGGLEDLKRQDAIECLGAADAALRAPGEKKARRECSLALPAPVPPSARVRQRRLVDGTSRAPGATGRPMPSSDVLHSLAGRTDAGELAERGLRRALLSGWARSVGLEVDRAELARTEREWLDSMGVTPSQREPFLAACDLDQASLSTLMEELALERKVLDQSSSMLPDGPGWLEGLASETRLNGLWAKAVRHQKSPPARRRKAP